MKPERINQVIAEHFGWTRFEFNPFTNQQFAVKPGDVNPAYKYRIPNYCADLNAMHATVKESLNTQQREDFAINLERIISGDEFLRTDFMSMTEVGFLLTHADAKDYSEAFLKTVGKWEEE